MWIKLISLIILLTIANGCNVEEVPEDYSITEVMIDDSINEMIEDDPLCELQGKAVLEYPAIYYNFAISNSGTKIAYQDENSLVIRDILTDSMTKVEIPSDGRIFGEIMWAPNDKFIVLRANQPYIYFLDDGQLRDLDYTLVPKLIHPDSKQVIFTGDGPLVAVYNIDSGMNKKIEVTSYDILFSNTGKYFLVMPERTQRGHYPYNLSQEFLIINVETEEEKELQLKQCKVSSSGSSFRFIIDWSPDDKHLAFLCDDKIQIINTDTLEVRHLPLEKPKSYIRYLNNNKLLVTGIDWKTFNTNPDNSTRMGWTINIEDNTQKVIIDGISRSGNIEDHVIISDSGYIAVIPSLQKETELRIIDFNGNELKKLRLDPKNLQCIWRDNKLFYTMTDDLSKITEQKSYNKYVYILCV